MNKGLFTQKFIVSASPNKEGYKRSVLRGRHKNLHPPNQDLSTMATKRNFLKLSKEELGYAVF